ncbi:MAG: family 16 glycosylhydrolase [Acidobacteriota bacterium]|nr:family 16 glycosylhydrolase [Acidobacteriota bacterium]
MQKKQIIELSVLATGLLWATSLFAQCPTLVWSDEFDGTSVNEANWGYQIGGSGWGNNESQYYRPENATVSDGTLKITAKQEEFGGMQYTSTRMRSINKADFIYGRFEARIKMSYGRGIWPAFWMMPTDDVYGGWPRSGEIDIMENLGHERDKTHGTIHYGLNGHNYVGNSFRLFGGKKFSDDFHVFAVEKEPNEIRWYVDDILYMVQTPDTIAPEFWPFEERYHFILNLAVGGNWPGYPDETTTFPQVLEVDYVRVYDMSSPSINGERNLPAEASGKVYHVSNAPEGSTFSWSVPEGATITSGRHTDSITVDWGLTGGEVKAYISNACGRQQKTIEVYVAEPVYYDFSLENFDDTTNVTVASMNGTLTEIANPDTSGVNGSALCGEYVRNGGSQYDTLVYDTASIQDASDYANGTRKFTIDVYTTAPPGSSILLQLEDNRVAGGNNYPAGRHSRYEVFTTVQNAWERLEIPFLDRPDGNTGDTAVNRLVILFQANSFSGDTWIFDNLDSYTTALPPAPTAPGNLTAVAEDGTRVNLSWTDLANNESGFEIERAEDGANFSRIAMTAADVTDYADSGLTPATTYTYRIRAYNAGGNSAYTATAEAVTVSSTTMHVSNVVIGVRRADRGLRYGLARITVLDNFGSPVSNATVSGDFSGDFTGSGSGVTDANGVVIISTESIAGGKVTHNFCVNDVTHDSLSYEASDNVMNCYDGKLTKTIRGFP